MIEDIQVLRDMTGAGVMDCKKALAEANGDIEAAKNLLYKQGVAKAGAKSERKTGAGFLDAYIHNGRIGVLLELRCETDFVARGDLFRMLACELVMHISAMNPANTGELEAQPYVRDESITVGNHIKSAIAKTGENIRVERFCRYEL